ncbi:MAG: CDP-glycerol glycerophosphotransferase family protein [bacterium]|nr:CDP-glycerol glycerophosphotransferase family protein [bacterium]
MSNRSKTILFTLYAQNVYQHLFMPSGGVADQLTANTDYRVVFLVPPGVIEDLVKKSEIAQRKNVRIEVIQKMPKRTLLQNAFYFFYSYLVFTSTTKLLATFGARADAPPAGSNRHLFFIKTAIAHTFGKVPFIKKRVVPWLYQRIFRGRQYRALFESYRPDLVFISNIAHFPDPEIATEARRRRIRTLGMASNWDHLNKYFIPVYADILLTQNAPMKEEAVLYHNYDENKVVVVGFPEHDAILKKKKNALTREEFFKKIGIPAKSKLILFISGSVYCLDEPVILKEISDWIRDGVFGPDVCLMVRPYPQRTEKEKYKELEHDPRIIFNWLSNWENPEGDLYYQNSMDYADIAISVFSTTAIEAALRDKPVLTIGFDGNSARPYHQSVKRFEHLSHFRHVLDTGSVPVMRSFAELQKGIQRYLEDPSLHREERKKLIDRMCYRVDGKSSSRVVDGMIQMLNGTT